MHANRTLHVILRITSILVVPVQLVTTGLLGLLGLIPFVDVLISVGISLIWIVLFLGPLLGLSWICHKLPFLREPVGFAGLLVAFLGDTFVCLMPTFGEMETRWSKQLLCETWPYTWEYWQYDRGRGASVARDLPQLERVLKTVRTNVVLREYLLHRSRERSGVEEDRLITS